MSDFIPGDLSLDLYRLLAQVRAMFEDYPEYRDTLGLLRSRVLSIIAIVEAEDDAEDTTSRK